MWRDYLWRGYLVARLQSGYRWQSNISLKSATFQLHFGFSSLFSAILHLKFIGKHIGLCFGSWDADRVGNIARPGFSHPGKTRENPGWAIMLF